MIMFNNYLEVINNYLYVADDPMGNHCTINNSLFETNVLLEHHSIIYVYIFIQIIYNCNTDVTIAHFYNSC